MLRQEGFYDGYVRVLLTECGKPKKAERRL